MMHHDWVKMHKRKEGANNFPIATQLGHIGDDSDDEPPTDNCFFHYSLAIGIENR